MPSLIMASPAFGAASPKASGRLFGNELGGRHDEMVATTAGKVPKATAASIAALKKGGKLGPEQQAHVAIVEALAEALDAALEDAPQRRYTVPACARELRAALDALGAAEAPAEPSQYDLIEAELLRNSPYPGQSG